MGRNWCSDVCTPHSFLRAILTRLFSVSWNGVEQGNFTIILAGCVEPPQILAALVNASLGTTEVSPQADGWPFSIPLKLFLFSATLMMR